MFEEPLEDQGTPSLHAEQKNNHEIPPNNTLYISNLNEKVPLDELKDTLFEML